MEVIHIKVVFFEKENGSRPAQDFIDSLDLKMKVKVIGLIKGFEEKGSELREPYSKKLTRTIFELRIKVGSNIARCLYFSTKKNEAILTNGFMKKSNKPPIQEIVKADLYRTQFLNQRGEETND